MTGPDARPRTPDWALWLQIPAVKAWEAVALSLDIDPKAITRVNLKAATAATARRDDKIGDMAKTILDSWSGPTWRFDESQEFNKRCEVATRNVEALPSVGTALDDADRIVRLADVAAMALSLGWEIPRELTALAKPVKHDHHLAGIQQAYDLERKKQGKEPSQRDVADRVPCARATVSKRWDRIKKW